MPRSSSGIAGKSMERKPGRWIFVAVAVSLLLAIAYMDLSSRANGYHPADIKCGVVVYLSSNETMLAGDSGHREILSTPSLRPLVMSYLRTSLDSGLPICAFVFDKNEE